MPPSTPRREVVLDTIVSTLAQIDGGTDYFNDFSVDNGARVKRFRFMGLPAERPFLLVRALESDLSDEKITGTNPIRTERLNFAVTILTVDVEATAPTSIEKLIHDVTKKLQVTTAIRTQSSTVINTYLESVSEPILDTAAAPSVMAEVRGYVLHRYFSTDPSAQA